MMMIQWTNCVVKAHKVHTVGGSLVYCLLSQSTYKVGLSQSGTGPWSRYLLIIICIQRGVMPNQRWVLGHLTSSCHIIGHRSVAPVRELAKMSSGSLL